MKVSELCNAKVVRPLQSVASVMVVAVGMSLAPTLALAQGADAGARAFPTKPVRIIVPFTPGGPTDIVSRMVSVEMTKALGQAVLVENMPGANANLGAVHVQKSAPDGHTVLASTWGNVIQPIVSKEANFSLQTDFAPVTLLYMSQYLMLAPSTMPYNDLRQANAYAKSNPGKISFGSPGNRSLIHISLEHWKRQAGLNIVHVQYKGEGDVVKALLSGEVQLGVVSLVNGGPMIKGGRVKAIATPSPSRLPGYPDVQTFEDIGVKDIDLWNYTGLHVPAGTPASAIQTLRSASIGALNSAETKKRFAEMGGVSVGNTAEEYGSFIAGEVRRWQGVVKSLGTEFE